MGLKYIFFEFSTMYNLFIIRYEESESRFLTDN